MVQTAWRILIAEDDVDLNNGITFFFFSGLKMPSGL